MSPLLDAALPLLFSVVALQAGGVPVPATAALVGAGVLATEGHLPIVWVIVAAAAGAVMGGGTGYWLGKRVGRGLVGRCRWTRGLRDRLGPSTAWLFERHGRKAVFAARFVKVLRWTAPWLAGGTGMPWRRFLACHALGAVAWASLVGLFAYFLGRGAIDAVRAWGFYGAALGVATWVGVALVARRASARLASMTADAPVTLPA